jgi:3-hydroxybutyryl-CoA dehydrogenase
MDRSLPLKKVSVVGSGILGSQIAMVAAYKGYEVKVFDPRKGAFRQTLEKLRADFKAKGIKPLIPWNQWGRCEAKIRQSSDLAAALKGAELVIEAVPENLELKKEIFSEIGKKAPQGALLATNSSSIPVSRMEASSGRPESCLNIHFYLPLQGVAMVDIMGGTQTDPNVLERGKAWIRSLGFLPLTVNKELLGFCFNRVWRSIKREVLYMWGNDFVDFRDVDRAWMVFTGMKEGPFGIMDKVGLDVVYDIEMVYYRESQDPKDHPPDALKAKIARGELGVKSGRGFYAYPDPEFIRPDFLKASR